MALLPAYYTTTKTSKSKSSVSSKSKEEHEAWLRKNGVHPSQIKGRSKSSGSSVRSLFSVPVSRVEKPDLSDVGVTGQKKVENKYTGKEIMGVAVMHKSCLQPVRTKEAAADIARMRRG